MKKRLNLSPLALTCDGRVLLNVAALDGPLHPETLLKRALSEPGAVFVGIELSSTEVAAAMYWAKGLWNEPAAHLAGARQKRIRRRRPRGQPRGDVT